MAEHWHETVEPYQEPHDVALEGLSAEERAQVEAQVAEMQRIAAENPNAGH
ncbi:hypothetical protein [Nesterenkonia rhizosphaerae]|uniref:Uncharacterized protein n=1 Tax=Nesterenkonia rhizosphaerae TaxID=1348272 RepID=A0ABP9G8G8_9MICC